MIDQPSAYDQASALDQLSAELLDLTVSVKGRRAAAYAFLISCCSCCSCCGSRTDD